MFRLYKPEQGMIPDIHECSVGYEEVYNKFVEDMGLKVCSAPRGIALQNGGNIHNDVNHAEYATPEALGPRAAAAADFAGSVIIRKLAALFGDNTYAFRRAATAQPTRKGRQEAIRTTGYHENYLFPSSLIGDKLMMTILPTYLVTRVWSGKGLVCQDGFHLFQKASGVASNSLNDMTGITTEGRKPMYILKSNNINSDSNINQNYDWARLEVRFADPGESPAARFMALGTASLVLRMLEHPKITAAALTRLSINNALPAKTLIDRDLSFATTYSTGPDRKRYNVLDIGEGLAELALQLADIIQLPRDEQEAAVQWRHLIDDLRACDPKNYDYRPVADVVDFVPKLHDLIRHYGIDGVNADNDYAINRDMGWDSVWPAGNGSRYWQRVGGRQQLIPPGLVEHLVEFPPDGTRGVIRGQSIRQETATHASWIRVVHKDGSEQHLPEGYLCNLDIAA